MRHLDACMIARAVGELCIEACCRLPEDVLKALERARDLEIPAGAAHAALEQLIKNARLASETMRPCCQDTGMAVVFLDIGQDTHIRGDVYDAVNEGISAGYREGYLRKSVLTPFSRENTGSNAPGVIHIRLVPGENIDITVAPKGFGSENMSRLYMLKPAQGKPGVLNAVAETVICAGACACPPVVVGVGVGGTMEAAALLAKRQLLRPLGEPSADVEIRALERDALERVNASGIGPMGLGGRTTALAVHIAAAPTHLAGLPVAVNMQCHACRHAHRRI